MSGFVRDGGVWRSVNALWVRDGGVWRSVLAAWIRDGGVWRTFFSSTPGANPYATIDLTGAEWTSGYTTWRARVRFDVNVDTASVKVDKSVNGGAYSFVEYVNTTPSQQNVWCNYVSGLAAGDYITFRITPFSEANGGGVQGSTSTQRVDDPPAPIVSIDSNESAWTVTDSVWQARVRCDTSADVESVKVEKSVNSGAYSLVEYLDVTGGAQDQWTSYVTALNDGDTITFRLTPYTGDNGAGVAGTAVTQAVSQPAYVATPVITIDSSSSYWTVTNSTWSARVRFDCDADVESVKVEKSVNGGAYSLVETIDTTPSEQDKWTSYATGLSDGNTITFRLTPYSGNNATKAVGSAETQAVSEPDHVPVVTAGHDYGSAWKSYPDLYQASQDFSFAHCASIKVEESQEGGAWSQINMVNSPASPTRCYTGVAIPAAFSVQLRITGYTQADLGGSAGAPVLSALWDAPPL